MIFPSLEKKKIKTFNAFYLPFQRCPCQFCTGTIIDIAGKMLQPFRGEAGVQRNNFMFCQKVTFSNLSEMADILGNALYQQCGVEPIVSPMYVINHVRV